MKKFLTTLLLLHSFIYANSYALVIGVNGHGLVGASNDASIMQTLLVKKHIKNIKLLTNENATKNRIIKEFSSIADRAKTGDYVYLFFSGHGTNENDPNISDRLKKQLKQTGGLVPYDLEKLDYNSLVVIKRDLVQYFKELERKRANTIIIFDACFSGGSFKEFQPTKGYLSLYSKPSRNYSNYPYSYITFLSASTKLDSTAESGKKRRGFYSMAITKCLKKHSKLDSLKSCMKKENNFTSIFLSKNKNSYIFPL